MSTRIQNKEIFERVARVEVQIENVNDSLNELKNNHLHHMQKDINELKIKVNTLTTRIAVATTIAVIIVEAIAKFFIK